MSFPTQLLDGYRHAVLSLSDDQAKLLIFLDDGGISRLVRDLARRCPTADLFAIGPGHYAIEDAAFRGDIARCALLPGVAVLAVQAPHLDRRSRAPALPVAVGRLVHSETGSLWCGVIAGLGTLAAMTYFRPAIIRCGTGGRRSMA